MRPPRERDAVDAGMPTLAEDIRTGRDHAIDDCALVAGQKAGAALADDAEDCDRLSWRGRSWSSASSAIACGGTARLLSRVLVCLTRPFAYAVEHERHRGRDPRRPARARTAPRV